MESFGQNLVSKEAEKPLPHRQGSKGYLYFAVLVASTGGFIFGFANFVISGVIIFISKQFSLTPAELGFAISSMMIGCLIGAGIAGAISDRLGRKKAMRIASLLWAVSAVGCALAQNMTELNLLRICGGVGVGIAMLVSPIYISEISPAYIRGRLGTANQFIIVSGGLAAFLVSYAFSFSGSWRWTFATGVVPALFLLMGSLLVPESPRWLIENDRQPEALAILTKINGEAEAMSCAQEITQSFSGAHGSFGDLFRRGTMVALIVGSGIAALQQLTGSGMAASYAPVIFQKAGFGNPSLAIGLTASMFVFCLFCVLIAYVLVDRVGRKPLLLWGTVGMGVGHIVLGLSFLYGWSAAFAFGAVVLIQAVANITWGPLGWVVLGEIFPNQIRAKAMAVATFILWVSMIASVQLFPLMVAYFESKYGSGGPTFLVFAAICALAYIFVWRMLPETKGRSLEEIARFWS